MLRVVIKVIRSISTAALKTFLCIGKSHKFVDLQILLSKKVCTQNKAYKGTWAECEVPSDRIFQTCRLEQSLRLVSCSRRSVMQRQRGDSFATVLQTEMTGKVTAAQIAV